MIVYGVTAAGFIKKPLSVILAELQAEARLPENFGPDIDLSSFSPVGTFIGMMSGKDAEKWDIAEDVYYQNQIDNADGVNLDRLTALRNVTRNPAKKSIGVFEYTGAEGSNIPLDAICQNAQGVQFKTTQIGTIPVSGIIEVQAEAVEADTETTTGNVPVADITTIVTAIPGVTAVTNNDVFQGGTTIETDAELRARYKSLVGTSGSAAPVIQLAFEDIPDVISASVLENNIDFSVGDLTPHSIKAVSTRACGRLSPGR